MGSSPTVVPPSLYDTHRLPGGGSENRRQSCDGSAQRGVAMVESHRRKMCSVLGAKRRRHKTVHFGEVLNTPSGSGGGGSGAGGGSGSGSELGSAAGAREDRGSVHSLPGQFEANVQQLFSFIGSVLSSWERRSESRRLSRKEAVRLLLRGDPAHKESEAVGSPSYKHTHWKVPAGSCTALFLNKVKS
ncbi:hypothetical protein GE061_012008 [Apolygus lucorum]|uniref:Uncharacterized protein n=1 Tax=Apolygus lucorum TaxID=248454 RepID=A0A8S9XTS3_APOLU|nr:hypothetical protein GE061_012008 [Apolygus lucorum]